MDEGVVSSYEYAIKLLESISGWKDADGLITECEIKIEELKAKAEAERLERERQAEIARIEAKKRNKKIATIAGIIACIVVAFVVVLNTVVIPYVDYNNAVSLMKDGKYTEAIAEFDLLGDYKDSKKKITECRELFHKIEQKEIENKYKEANALMNEGKYTEALSIFYGLNGYKDSAEKIRLLIPNETISAGNSYTVGLKSDGTVVATGSNYYGQCDVSDWTDIVSISAGETHTVGLKSDGTVVATGDNDYGQCDVSDWTDIVSVTAGSNHTVGLKSDGTVVATGDNYYGQCDVSDWTDIVSISAGWNYTVGVKSDGTVVATGDNDYGKYNVSNWTDIVSVSTGNYHTVGVKSDGTVVATGWNDDGQCDVSNWTDIVSVSTGNHHTVGVKSDGTVIATGSNYYGQSDVESWKITTSQRQIENKGKK